MKDPTQSQRNIPTSLLCAGLLLLAKSASAELIVTTAHEHGTANTYPFSPSWTVTTNNSLIAGLAPSSTFGDFSLETPISGLRSAAGLTLNTDLSLSKTTITNSANGTTDRNYVTCGNGSGSGRVIVYTLPSTANGYNLTNITVYGGWADSGRDALAHTILYSTVADPNSFIVLTNVAFNPSVPSSTASANRAVIADTGGSVIAANVAAIKFVFDVPSVENGFAGVAAITVGGTAAGSIATPRLAIATSTETGASPFTPSWTIETPNLIGGASPSSSSGNFNLEGSTGTSVLTDGAVGISGDNSTLATAGAGGGSGSSLVYALPNQVNGTDVTNVVVYSGWGDGGRDGQYFTLSYSTVAAPTTYIRIGTVYLNPAGTSGAVANRVAFSMNNGSPLGSGVANLRLEFATPTDAGAFDNGYQGYGEIVVQGHDTAAPPPPPSPYLVEDTLPSYMETVVGEEAVFTAVFSNAPPANLQWQFLSGGVTNDLAGATNATLKLSNVQLANAGSYRVKAVNATNAAAAPSYSTAASLAVSNVPAAVNNIVMRYSGQSGLGAAGASTNFYPTWNVDTNNDLILGFQTTASGPGTATAGLGDYGLSGANGDPTILADGSVGYLNYWPNVGGSPSLISAGPFGGAGLSMTYELDTGVSPNGFDLTNIVVYGGWGDAGRNEQKYQVLYSTVAAPTTFISLGTFNYNPNNPNSAQSATRVSLVPASGALAQNVYAVQINWNLQGSPPKNGWEGYSEIVIKGSPAAPKPVLTQDITPVTADDVVGGTLTLTAGFSGATSYQWQKNGTNIPGATSASLTLANLQLTDTATNGGYRLVASNGAGGTATRECRVIVNPAPTASGNVAIAFAHQTSDAGTFSPTWETTTFGASLISGAFPDSYGSGDFTDPDSNPNSHGLAGGLPVLTDADFGSIVDGGPHPAFATVGPGAGQFVVYTLPASTHGHTITNIVIASGWNDAGRDDLWGTVLYSTVANPTTFIPITVVTNKPVASTKSVTRATLNAVNGVLASNVHAIMVDFTTPGGLENGYIGVSQINVFGSPSSGNTLSIGVTTENQNTDTPSWTVETPNLIAGQLPGSVGPGDFDGDFNNEPPTIGLPALTDGSLGPTGFGNTNFATAGGAFGAGSSITYTSAGGWNLTNIVVYSGWGDYNRDGQFYNITYSTIDAPATFVPLVSVDYNPTAGTGPSVNRVAISPINGATALATNVYAVTFDFTRQGNQDNGYSGYSEIVLQGVNLNAIAIPPTINRPVLAGGNLILTGTGGTPGRGYSLISSTNVALPLANWTVSATGTLNGAGSFSNAIPVNASEPMRYFTIRIP